MACRGMLLDEAAAAVGVEPLGDFPEGRPHDPFERAACRMGKVMLRQDGGPRVGGLLLFLTGIGRQEIVNGTEASIVARATNRGQWQ